MIRRGKNLSLCLSFGLLVPALSLAFQDFHKGAFSIEERELSLIQKLSGEARIMDLKGLGECLVAVGHAEIKGRDRAALIEAQRAAEAAAKGHMTEFIHGLKTETSAEIKTTEKVVSILSGGETKEKLEVTEEYSSYVRTRGRGALRATRLLGGWTSDDGSVRTVAVVFSKSFVHSKSPVAGILREGENSLESHVLDGQRAIRAAGFVPLAGGDAGSAREQALAFARENAVREGLGTLVESETIADEVSTKIRLREKARGYVIEEHVVDEGPEGDFYRVILDTIVSLELLDNDTRAFRMLQEQIGMPRLAIRLEEKWADGRAGSGSAASQLREMFQKKGYRLVAPGVGGAEVVVEGTCTTRHSGSDKFGRHRVSASTDYRAVVVSTGKLLASGQDTQRVAMKTLAGAAARAGQRASRLTFQKLHEQIVEQWGEIARSGDTFAVVLTQVTSYRKQGRGFERLLRGIEGVKEVQKRSFEAGVLTLGVQFRGKSADLEDAIFSALDSASVPSLAKIDFRKSAGNRLEFFCQN